MRTGTGIIANSGRSTARRVRVRGTKRSLPKQPGSCPPTIRRSRAPVPATLAHRCRRGASIHRLSSIGRRHCRSSKPAPLPPKLRDDPHCRIAGDEAQLRKHAGVDRQRARFDRRQWPIVPLQRLTDVDDAGVATVTASVPSAAIIAARHGQMGVPGRSPQPWRTVAGGPGHHASQFDDLGGGDERAWKFRPPAP